ncbi:hypothetical protein NTCA1_45840 [Novosphingobium sp. TCA1]|nr:hypothetical protein NTCA1_45840 [Novosphingobium sp. TCA1]
MALLVAAQKHIDRKNELVRVKGSELVDKHLPALLRRRRQLVKVDDYGVEDASAWQKEAEQFFHKVVSPTLPNPAEYREFHSFFTAEVLGPKLAAALKEQAASLPNRFTNDIDPVDFEHLCAERLRAIGWNARVTKGSGDQGADIVATKGADVMVVQCKRYAKPVGNKAIQEIVGAMRFYEAGFALVVATNGYTKAAQQLAKVNDVMLGHHDDLVFGWAPYSVTAGAL